MDCATQISVKIRIGDWLHSNEVMVLTKSWQAFAAADDAIDKSPNGSVERAHSLHRVVVRSARRPPKVSAPGLFRN
jgi:hypothetical protein